MTEPGESDLSRRGRRLVERPPFAEYLQEHFRRAGEAWDPAARPDGYIALCVAENQLVADLILPELGAARALPASVLGYDAMTGSLPFREQLAQFLPRFMGRPIAAEQLAVLAGAGSVLELLFYALADPGDAVLVPTPSYAGFWPDLELRDELTLVPVHGKSANGFKVTVADLDLALERTPQRVRALLFTSPDNPTGRVYAPAELRSVIAWAEQRQIHLVMDEIYALSVFGPRRFVSAAELRPKLGERLHLVWAFSKDFAMSGLRCGVLVSENAELHAALNGLAYWECASGLTQHVLGQMLSNRAWLERYLAETKQRLGHAHAQVTAALMAQGIAFLPSEAGFFLLLDLRQFLGAPTWDAEEQLWRRLLREANVNLTPGAACRVGEPGFMRLCFAATSSDAALEAIRRLGRVLPR